MKTFSIGAAIKRGWTLFKNHKMALVFSLLSLFVLQSVASHDGLMPGGHHREVMISVLLLGIVVWVIVTIVKIGWLNLLLMIDEGKKPEWTEIFAHPEHVIVFVLTGFLYALGTALLSILFIIPGIYFALTYCFVPLLVIDTDLEIGESFTRSAAMTKGHKWKLFGFFITLLGLVILGAIALVVGLLVAIPVAGLAYVHVYKILSEAHT
ncbi:MAG: hypothetical protein JWN50_445 [Parcubacteria group bacterium]|nr:hypothetical protein [Parcubacteria group bacterium]